MAKQTLSGVRLSRESVVAAARKIIEEEGVAALSMRRLAGALGSSPMAIYHHVEGRADLLSAVLGELSAGQPVPELPADPVERMVFASTHTLSKMAAMPWMVEVIRTNVAFGRGGMWTVEAFLSAGAELGFSDEQTLHLFFTVWRIIVGDVVAGAQVAAGQPAEAGADAGAVSEAAWNERLAKEDLADIPHVARVLAVWQAVQESYDPAAQLAALIRAEVAAMQAAASA